MNIYVYVFRLNYYEKINMIVFFFFCIKCLCLFWIIGVIFWFVLLGVGYGICLVFMLVGMYYNIIIVWGVFYMFVFFWFEVFWVGCNNLWNIENCMLLLINFNKSLIINFILIVLDEYYMWVIYVNYFLRKGV